MGVGDALKIMASQKQTLLFLVPIIWLAIVFVEDGKSRYKQRLFLFLIPLINKDVFLAYPW
jgi:hypothetical protein